jgi:hypothetical protein
MIDVLQAIVALALPVLAVLAAMGWLHGLTPSIRHRKWGLLFLEIVFSPIAIIHGWADVIFILAKNGRTYH